MFCLFVCLYFCWQLLISENTLIQVVKFEKKKERKNKRKNSYPNPGRRRMKLDISPLGH